ncbi:hypothetical protein LTR64_006923 [Lithohypha guttulata]|uniref:uncharacterized protein n=1 Tax=Lithohypha guttulata TaxID=1690604 RepID=UPI002DDF5D19|nr:hypothetical protein LTR51_004520 [Lithohypha guttulata]
MTHTNPKSRHENERPTPHKTNQSSSQEFGMKLEDIKDDDLRQKTLTLLRTVPTIEVTEAYDALNKSNKDVEAAAWSILEQQQIAGKKKLQLNEFVGLDVRIAVIRLSKMCPDVSTQDCYVAVRAASGNLDDAFKHIQYMNKEKDMNSDKGAVAFLNI